MIISDKGSFSGNRNKGKSYKSQQSKDLLCLLQHQQPPTLKRTRLLLLYSSEILYPQKPAYTLPFDGRPYRKK
jgi:hypothetical protein